MRRRGRVADMMAENFFQDVRSGSAGAQNPGRPPAEVTGVVKEIATEEEVRAALLALGDDGLELLELRAAGYRRLLPPGDVEDLVGEALRRGPPGWPEGAEGGTVFGVFLQKKRRNPPGEGKRKPPGKPPNRDRKTKEHG